MKYTVRVRDDLFNFVERDYERGNFKDKEDLTDCALLMYIEKYLEGYTIRYVEVLSFGYPYCIKRFNIQATRDIAKGVRILRTIGIDGYSDSEIEHITELLHSNNDFVEYAKGRSKKNKPIFVYKQVI